MKNTELIIKKFSSSDTRRIISIFRVEYCLRSFHILSLQPPIIESHFSQPPLSGFLISASQPLLIFRFHASLPSFVISSRRCTACIAEFSLQPPVYWPFVTAVIVFVIATPELLLVLLRYEVSRIFQASKPEFPAMRSSTAMRCMIFARAECISLFLRRRHDTVIRFSFAAIRHRPRHCIRLLIMRPSN